jgi:hypothetical protein
MVFRLSVMGLKFSGKENGVASFQVILPWVYGIRNVAPEVRLMLVYSLITEQFEAQRGLPIIVLDIANRFRHIHRRTAIYIALFHNVQSLVGGCKRYLEN